MQGSSLIMVLQQKFIVMAMVCAALIIAEPESKPVNVPKTTKKMEKKQVKAEEKKSKKKEPELTNEQLICALYTGISGFGIPQSEENKITECGGAPTYGEILYESLKTILDDMPKSIIKNGVLYDLGSGVGKVCVQAYLDYPFKKVVGIELSKKRFDGAMDVLETLTQEGRIDPKRTLEFINEDFTKVTISDATVIYMCSTCYSAELMAKLGEKFAKLNPGLQVITLKSMPDYEKYGLELTKEYKLPMTWSKDSGGSPVYVYTLTGKKKKEPEVKPAKKSKTEKKKEKMSRSK